MKRANLDWMKTILRWWGALEKTVAVARLKADPSYSSEEARVAAFVAVGHGSWATYFRLAQRLRSVQPLPKTELTNQPPHHPGPNKVDWLDFFRNRHRELGYG